jgi:membrane protease YdiL (CAAX protease family)
MTLEKFFTRDGQLRPIWRFFLSTMMILVAYVGVGMVLGVIFTWLPAPAQAEGSFAILFCLNILLLSALLGIYKILTFVFEQRPLGSVGLARHRRWKIEFGSGAGVGAAMILVVAGTEVLLRLSRFSGTTEPGTRVAAFGALSCLVLLVAAATEELMFRGYPFQRLVEAIGPFPAVLVTSALFGFVHLENPHRTWLSTTNTALVGVPFAIAYLRTRSLWMPMGMHFAWNFIQGFVLGLPVSGLVFPGSLLTAQVQGSTQLTGADYGPEGSLLTTGVVVLVSIYLLVSKSIYISNDMRELVFGRVASAGLAGNAAEAGLSRDQGNGGLG